MWHLYIFFCLWVEHWGGENNWWVHVSLGGRLVRFPMTDTTHLHKTETPGSFFSVQIMSSVTLWIWWRNLFVLFSAKMPSVMEVDPCYTLLPLFTLYCLYCSNCFRLLWLLEHLEHTYRLLTSSNVLLLRIRKCPETQSLQSILFKIKIWVWEEMKSGWQTCTSCDKAPRWGGSHQTS